MDRTSFIHEIPDNSTVDFITPEIIDDHSYLFRKVYLPAAIIRLSERKNFVGEGSVHCTGRDIVGYHEARDYFHVAPDSDQTLRSLQGQANDQVNAAVAFGLTRQVPNIAQVIGLRIDPSLTTDHYYGKYFTVESTDVAVSTIDPYSRLGLYRLLGEPAGLEWFIEDINPRPETRLCVYQIN